VSLRFVTAAEVERLGFRAAADALERALADGLDPEADPPRDRVAVGEGELLLMPSLAGARAAVKLVTVGGDPHVQGVCVVFDTRSLAPLAVIDGIALTNLRTAAVSALAARRLAAPGARRLLVFGRGPQGRAHVEAMRAVLGIEHVDMIGRDHPDPAALVARADVVCCCTTAREPLFPGELVPDHAVVVAMGTHEADARETDDALARRATVVVESRASALREAGDITAAIDAGALAREDIVTLAEVVRGEVTPAPDRPRLFKSTGMSWEDAVVAAALT